MTPGPASLHLSDDDLTRLMTDLESFRVERKRLMNRDTAGVIREAICGFANDLPGSGLSGVIFVGAEDDGSPSDLPVTDQLLSQLADMKTDGNIVPPPSMLVDKRFLQGAEVAVVTVAPSDSPPVRCQGMILVRDANRRARVATAQDERILNERRRTRDIPFDLQPVPGCGLTDFNLRYFEAEYLPQAFASSVLEANERTLVERLAATKMIKAADDPVATVLGVLVIGLLPQDIVPGAYVQFLRLAGDDVIDAAEFRGTLSDILRQTEEKLKAHISTGVSFVGPDRELRRVNYPLAALQQLVRNALMHRTYEATHAPVRVTWMDDRIEIFSPGGPFGIVTADNFGHPGVTDYRNPNLAAVMKDLGYVQRFGMGIASARRLLQGAGLPNPEFSVDQGYVQVVVHGRPA